MIIDKVVRIYLDPDDLEIVMRILRRPEFDTEAWCSEEDFPRQTPLKRFIEANVWKALKKNEIDYIVFKLNY